MSERQKVDCMLKTAMTLQNSSKRVERRWGGLLGADTWPEILRRVLLLRGATGAGIRGMLMSETAAYAAGAPPWPTHPYPRSTQVMLSRHYLLYAQLPHKNKHACTLPNAWLVAS